MIKTRSVIVDSIDWDCPPGYAQLHYGGVWSTGLSSVGFSVDARALLIPGAYIRIAVAAGHVIEVTVLDAVVWSSGDGSGG